MNHPRSQSLSETAGAQSETAGAQSETAGAQSETVRLASAPMLGRQARVGTSAVLAGRTVAITAVLALTAIAGAAPAAALNRDDGDDPGSGLSILETVGLFVALPLVLFALCALYVYGPSSAKGPRYRPGVGWWAQPVWFTGTGRGSGHAPDGASDSSDGDRIAPAATGVSRSATSVTSAGSPATAVDDAPSGASSLGDAGGGGRDPGHTGSDSPTRTSPEGGASARW